MSEKTKLVASSTSPRDRKLRLSTMRRGCPPPPSPPPGGGISRSRIKMDISDQRSRIPLFIQLFTNLAQVSGFPFPLCRKTHILSSRLDHTDRLSYRRLRIHR